MKENKKDIKIKRITVNLNDPTSFPKWNVNQKILDSTTEEDIARQIIEDDLEAMNDAETYKKSRSSKRLFLSLKL
jgi:putative transcriptional regulator